MHHDVLQSATVSQALPLVPSLQTFDTHENPGWHCPSTGW
jgi:hypothetical protein